jgi:hypothetical protein
MEFPVDKKIFIKLSHKNILFLDFILMDFNHKSLSQSPHSALVLYLNQIISHNFTFTSLRSNFLRSLSAFNKDDGNEWN